MKPVLFFLAFAFTLAIQAPVAEARPDARKMTCAAAQALVRQSGAIVMTTGQFTYDRIVAHRGYCAYDEETRSAIAPTVDNPACRIGYYCRPSLRDHDGFSPFHQF